MPKSEEERKVPRKARKNCCRELDVDHLEIICPKCKGVGTLASHQVGAHKVDRNWDSIPEFTGPGAAINVIECPECRGRGTIPSKTGLKLLEFLNAYKEYDASTHPLIGRWKKEDEECHEEDED